MRSKSLLLIAVDFLIMFAGLGIIMLGQYPKVDYSPIPWALGAAVLGIAVQLFLIKGRFNDDIWIFPMVLFFSSVGIIMLARLKPILCVPQLRWLIIGMLVMVLVLYFSRQLKNMMQYQYILGICTLVVLCLSLLFGVEIGGSKNWLVLGPFSVQPSEFGKILLVLFLAAFLSDHKDMLKEARKKFLFLDLPPLRFIAPLLVIWGIAILMFVVQRDLGSALLFFCMAVFMTYMGTGSKSYVFIAMCFICLGAVVSYTFFSHVQVRFNIWLDPWQDAVGQAYQVVQSLFAFAAGGVWGTGFTHGHPGLIPEVHTDFIFSAIGEEFGLLGCTVIMMVYVLLFYRGIMVALNCKKELHTLVAAGFSIALFTQAFIIIAGVTKFLPLTGITLPFISYGGSSMVSGFIMIGLLLALSKKERVNGA
ncbi:MAG: FtsW/RodA/SpoVE family cell cycle protein [Anaerovibrio sp.]|uniref:FtsW/RodA/SpoVE family cell cycle protein n=1 Tax=Anaerovibrio sp. TaxID=1872532 RepID=UPI0025C5EFBC|nr:FtsW/RodA/SpoVE family cell cycle protein [Anaerovibrio sp.]MBE6100340.1 FtsW/RodA/SpoVE family cell cycle protein [Anaerovibrio sp.]